MKAIYTLLILLIPFVGFGQEIIKEITRTYENGQPMFIDYLEVENLKKVKKEIFDINGELIFSINYDPISGLPDGDFYDKKNKGFFKNGELTCYDCTLVEENIPSVFSYNFDKQNTKIIEGNVINGRYEGKIEEYGYLEKTISQIDWKSTRRYIAAGLPLGFRDLKTYGTGDFIRLDSKFYNYNSDGMIDGWHKLDNWYIGEGSSVNSKTAKAKYVNGMIESFISYDNFGKVVDSLSNDNELWKINYKWVKNDGHLVFHGQNEIYVKKITKNSKLPIFLIGGLVHIGKDEIYTAGGNGLLLNNNGIYSIPSEEKSAVYEILTGYNIDEKNNSFSLSSHNYTKYSSKSCVDFLSIYNYLKYDDITFATGNLYTYNYNGYQERDRSLIKKFFREDTNNPFPKYMKHDQDSLMNYYKTRKRLNISFYNDLFFTNTITLSNFLKAIDELVGEEKDDLYKLYVWDKVKEKYEKVNLKNLIDLAVQKEKTLLSETTNYYCVASKKMYYKNEPAKITITNRKLKILYPSNENDVVYHFDGIKSIENGENIKYFKNNYEYIYEYNDGYYLHNEIVSSYKSLEEELDENKKLILCDIYNNSFNKTDSLNALNEIKDLYEQEKLDKKKYKKLKKIITPK